MKIVIIGGSGMIGSYLIKSCKNEGSDKIVDAASAVVASMNQKLQTTITELNAAKAALERERAERNKPT